MTGFHEISLLSAGLAFFTFLAITPLLATTVMVYGLVGDPQMVREEMSSLVTFLPHDAATLIEGQLMRAVTTAGGVTGFALVIALFFAIYGAMRGAWGIISALNIINEEMETRSIWRLSLRAVWLTLAMVLIAIVGITCGVVFAWLETQSSGFLGGGLTLLIKIVTWLAAILLGSGGFALVMRYGPDRNPAKWRWLAPGAVIATLLWIVISFGFSLYIAYVSNYNATYGSLSAVVVFIMWLYLSAYGILLGALLNAEIERQTITDTTRGPDRPPGERGAVLADMIEAPRTSEEAYEKRRRRAERARWRADRLRHLRRSRKKPG
jgi:membrane protein